MSAGPVQAAYEALIAHARQTQALASAAGVLGWDQETMMPRDAAPQRAAALAAREAVIHARHASAEVGGWLATIEAQPDALGPEAAAQARLVARAHARAVRVPARLASELARVTSLAQGHWAAARAADDVPAFLPWLEQVIALRREEAGHLARPGQEAYDALLELYEPGATAEGLEAMFAALRPRLVALRDRALGADRQPARLVGNFGTEGQMRLARLIAGTFGYDWSRGRLDLAVHPFSSGSGADVRITTRVDEADPFNCLYSTLHEVGHATYEQAVAPHLALTPAGQGASMGVHESQSRLYENQLGRSAAFSGWLHGRMEAEFGPLDMDAEAFFGTVNRLEEGFIRTEADEVQYNLHVALRFGLERDLIAGRLAPADLEEAWNAAFQRDFGRRPPRPALGMLQDVHWSVGLFGYFPTYTLGNVYAGLLHRALRADLPDLDADLSRGVPGPALDWLRTRLQCHGSLLEPAALIAQATGTEETGTPDPGPLLAYLEAKFAAIYGL
ncbi:MAG: carboxypeptidase M32 [Rhodobacteraceae bacterium]|nr:carboxypeptidase M32 [Paracoccaceae bacterium]